MAMTKLICLIPELGFLLGRVAENSFRECGEQQSHGGVGLVMD